MGSELEQEGIAIKEEWITTNELQRWLKLGKTKTNQILRSSEIPSYKIGRIRRIRRQDVEDWLEENRYRPGGE